MQCYDPATRPCASGPQRGAVALQGFILEKFPASRNLGIFNCRSVNHPGRPSSPSVHGNGRAGDNGFPGVAHAQGTALKDWLILVGSRIDLQFVIWNRKKYGCSWGWEARDYGGYAHTDHVHWELNRAGAATLTRERLEELWRESHGPTAPEPKEWDEMATKEEIRQLLDERIGAAFARLYPWTGGLVATVPPDEARHAIVPPGATIWISSPQESVVIDRAWTADTVDPAQRHMIGPAGLAENIPPDRRGVLVRNLDHMATVSVLAYFPD